MIIDRNGTAVRPKGGSGGGAAEDPLGKEPLTNIAGSIDFRVLLELSDVAAVQTARINMVRAVNFLEYQIQDSFHRNHLLC